MFVNFCKNLFVTISAFMLILLVIYETPGKDKLSRSRLWPVIRVFYCPVKLIKVRVFSKKLLPSEAQKSLRLIKAYLNFTQKWNVTTYATGGTLLGIYRYGTHMPWDDDIDFCIKSNDVRILKRFNSSSSLTIGEFYIHKGLYVLPASIGLRKICSFQPESSEECPRPSIDIYFYYGSRHTPDCNWSKPNVIFPLRRAKFMGLEVPVVNNIKGALANIYAPYGQTVDFREDCKCHRCSKYEQYFGLKRNNESEESQKLPLW